MTAQEALKISRDNVYISPEEVFIETKIFPHIEKQAKLGRTMITLTQSPFIPSINYIGDVLRIKYGYKIESKWRNSKLIVSWSE